MSTLCLCDLSQQDLLLLAGLNNPSPRIEPASPGPGLPSQALRGAQSPARSVAGKRIERPRRLLGMHIAARGA